jgi:hypothetical protein
MHQHSSARFMSIITLVLATLACGLPSATPVPTPVPVTPQPTLTPTPMLSPTPDLPGGWETYRSDGLAISLYHPLKWEAAPYDDHKLDLLETQGQGWIEIDALDTTTMDRWGLQYTPGMSAKSVLDALAQAARENGVFEAEHQIENRSGLEAWAVEGHYDALNDFVLIAAVALSDRGIIVVGHGGADEAEWERLRPIYQQVVWSITP